MTKYSFFLIFILCEILNTVYCGNEPFNLFGLHLNEQRETETSEFSNSQGKLSLEDNAVASEERNLKKKRLFFQEGEPQTEIHPDKYFTSAEYSSKRSNKNSPEDQKNLPEDMRSFKNNFWESERDRIRYSEEKENLGNPMEFRSREPLTGPYPRFDVEKGGISEKSQSLRNGENNFKLLNHHPDPRVGSSYLDRTFNGNVNDYSGARDRNVFDRRISIATLNEAEMRNLNKHRNDYRVNDMHSGYQMHSNMNYNARKDDRFWDLNPYKHEKGVIINFNTECPAPRQFNNQLVHRVILSPKSPITQSEISTYQYPVSGLISPHQLAPNYYF